LARSPGTDSSGVHINGPCSLALLTSPPPLVSSIHRYREKIGGSDKQASAAARNVVSLVDGASWRIMELMRAVLAIAWRSGMGNVAVGRVDSTMACGRRR
jgi:hypothetical protein